jgi:hypothetical protein
VRKIVDSMRDGDKTSQDTKDIIAEIVNLRSGQDRRAPKKRKKEKRNYNNVRTCFSSIRFPNFLFHFSLILSSFFLGGGGGV